MQIHSAPAIPPVDTHFGVQLFQTHAAELARRIRKPHPPFAVIDVRSAAAFARGHVPGAISATAESLADGLPPGVAPEMEVFVIGAGTEDRDRRRTALALRSHGVRRVVEVTGGMVEWLGHALPVETARAA